jgi:hypothetical protein
MKFLRYFLILLIGLLAIVLISAAFSPSRKIIKRSILINKPDYYVFQQVVDFKNWIKWNHWSEMEPSASNIISGEPKGVGSMWTWNGKLTSGTVSIDSIAPNNLIISNFTVRKTFEIKAIGLWTFKADSTKTLTVWQNESSFAYPVGRLLGLFMEKEIGKDMQTSLENLKKLCENE